VNEEKMSSAEIEALQDNFEELSDDQLDNVVGGKTNVKRPGTGDN
jgi:bacteriocin-like protein